MVWRNRRWETDSGHERKTVLELQETAPLDLVHESSLFEEIAVQPGDELARHVRKVFAKYDAENDP